MKKQISIFDIKHELEQADATILKLKIQEAKLSTSLSQLKNSLEQKTRNLQKKRQQNHRDQEKNEAFLKKEFQNAQKQLKIYKNQLKVYQERYSKKGVNGLQQMYHLEEELKNKDNQIIQLQKDIKGLEDQKRRQEKQLKKIEKKNDEGFKITRISQQVRTLKQLLLKAQSNLQGKKNNFESKQQFLNNLKKKYQQACQKLGLDPQQQIKKKTKSKKSTQKPKQKKVHHSIRELIKNSDNLDSMQINSQNFKQLKNKKIMGERSYQITKQRHARQIKQLQNKLKQLQKQGKDLQEKVKEKQKQKSFANYKLAQMKKGFRHRQLSPIK